MISRTLSRFLEPAVFYMPDGAPDGGSADEGDKPKQPTRAEIQAMIDDSVADTKRRHGGDSDAALVTLAKQNYALTQRAEAAENKAGQLPPDIASELDAYRAFGKPAEVKAAIESGTAATQKAAELEREKAFQGVAAKLGYKFEVLNDLAKAKGFSVAVEGEGENAKIMALYKEGDSDVKKPLAEYVESSLADYLPALQAGNGQQQGNAGTKWTGGSASGGTGAVNKFDAIRQEVKAKNEQQKPEPRDLSRAGIH